MSTCRLPLVGPRVGAISLALALVLTVAVAACSGDSREPADAGSGAAGTTVDIVDCSAATRCSVRSGSRTLGVVGSAADPVSVAPAADHPLATVDRDAGVAAQLRDGSILWLFGDTAARDDGGTISYFVIGTASWAPAARPTETHDHVDPGSGEPVPFAVPTGDLALCPRPGQRAGTWPAAAIVEPVGGRDRVIVWLENVCLGDGPTLDDAGMSVAEWWYDPTAPPDGAPVVATMLNPRLFPERSYGSAVTRGVDADELYAYRCRSTTDGGGPDDYGPCWVARTTVAGVADPTSYREWDGTAFTADIGEGVPLDLPAGPATAPHPPAGLTVTHDPTLDAYVMAYSPWPGPSEFLDLRVAPAPEGPWSTPVTIELPSCDDRIGERRFPCYAGGVQPSFSTPGRLGLGWYDSMISSFPTRGSYQISSVPIAGADSPGGR